MGTGVAARVCPPGNPWDIKRQRQGLLDLSAGAPRGVVNAAKRLAVSTGQLRRLPALHTRPIDPVVFREPSTQRVRRPRLAGGFTLRCLQRLSGPDIATQR